MNDLYAAIYDTVRQVLPGEVATYSQIAAHVGIERGARVVGWALRALPAESDVPWQRVVAKGGRISIVNPHLSPNEQRALLEAEGSTFEEHADEWVITNPTWHFPADLQGGGQLRLG